MGTHIRYQVCLKFHCPGSSDQRSHKVDAFGHFVLEASVASQVLDLIAIHAAEYLVTSCKYENPTAPSRWLQQGFTNMKLDDKSAEALAPWVGEYIDPGALIT